MHNDKTITKEVIGDKVYTYVTILLDVQPLKRPSVKEMVEERERVVNFDTAAPTPTVKERIIDAVLKDTPDNLYLTDDLKPSIKVRAMTTFNGFQGTAKEKAIQAIIHAHTELTLN